MDIRRRRTRLRLQAALRDLLAERPLAEISVESLAQRAGTTRQTFYANYSGLAEMLEEYLSALLDEIEARHGALLAQTTPEERPARMRSYVTSVFADIDRDDPRLKALLAGVPSLAAEARFAALVERLLERGDPAGQPPLPPTARRIQTHFYTGAFVGMLRLWVTGPEGVDADTMGHAFVELALHGRLGVPIPAQG